MNRTNRILAALLLCAIVVAGALQRSGAQAAPNLAPTAVASIHASAADGVAYFTLVSGSTARTADTNGPVISAPSYSLLDVQTTFDQTLVGTAANTTTLTLQYSNDGANWTNGPALATSNVADSTDLNQFANFGRYTRVNINVTNTNPVTITVLAVAKP